MSRAYPNEVIDRANAYHGYNFWLSADPVPVPHFEAQPSTPTFLVGAGDDYSFQNPSQNDGRSVYSRVITEYEDYNNKSEAIAYTPATAQSSILSTDVVISNSTFDANITGWTISGTGVWNAGGYLDLSGTPSYATLTGLTGSFKKGKSYRISFSAKSQTGANNALIQDVSDTGSAPTLLSKTIGDTGNIGTGFTSFQYDFTCDQDASQPVICLNSSSAEHIYYDNIYIYELSSNVVSRRGFTRDALRPMTSKSTAAAALAIAQLELDASQYPPLSGELSISGRIRVAGGNTVPVTILPSSVGKALLIENIQDPNTGAIGRMGVIKTATYNAEDDTATVTIDDPSNFIKNLRARLGEV